MYTLLTAGTASEVSECGCTECRCEKNEVYCSCPPVNRPYLYFHVDGLHCESCITRVELSLREKPGISSVDVDLNSKRLRVGCTQQLGFLSTGQLLVSEERSCSPNHWADDSGDFETICNESESYDVGQQTTSPGHNKPLKALAKVVNDTIEALGFSSKPQAFKYTLKVPESFSVFYTASSLLSELHLLGLRRLECNAKSREVSIQLCRSPDPKACKAVIMQALAPLGLSVQETDITETTQAILPLTEPSPPMCCARGFSTILSYTVGGMHCRSCVLRIELTLKELQGVADCSVDLARCRVQVTLAPDLDADALRPAIEAAVRGLGFTVAPARAHIFTLVARSGPPGWRDALLPVLQARFPDAAIAAQQVAVTLAEPPEGWDETFGILVDLARQADVLLRPEKLEVADISYNLRRGPSKTSDPSGCCTSSSAKGRSSLSSPNAGERPFTEAGPQSPSPSPAATEVAQFLIQGMSCASCSSKIELVLRRTEGVQNAVVNFATATAKVQYSPSNMSAAQIETLITGLGYAAKQVNGGVASRGQITETLRRTKEIRYYLLQFLISCIFALPLLLLMILGMWAQVGLVMDMMDAPFPGLPQVSAGAVIQLALATPVVLFCGVSFYVEAWTAVTHGSANMQVLISIGVWAAYGGSMVFFILIALGKMQSTDLFFAEGAVLIAFMLLGKLLESVAKKKTSEALLTLMDLQPNTTIRLETVDGKTVEEEVEVEFIEKGDVVKVMAGDRIPVDGVVVLGTTTVDESMITGESVPLPKNQGDAVIGGTINMEGLIHVQATKLGDESMLAQILKAVQDAQMNKAPMQAFADAIAGVFVPFVLGFAILTLTVWMVCGFTNAYPADWHPSESVAVFSLRFFIATLVVACPCAMGLATPTAVMVGTGVGARLGMLIKGGEPLETLAKVTAVLFDKTGTLTQGQVVVVDAQLLGDTPPPDVWRLVGEAEANSTHPVARAISRYCAERSGLTSFEPPSNLLNTPGRGLQCTSTLDGAEVLVQVGSVAYLGATFPLDAALADAIRAHQAAARTIVLAGVQAAASPTDSDSDRKVPRLLALFALSDSLRPEAAEALRYLREHLKLDVRMVSGDNQQVAELVGASLQLDPTHIHAEVLPSGKAALVAEHQAKGHRIAFVGDGVNDAPALARADVGVTLGAGTQVAMQCADVVLLRNNLCDLVAVLALARATVWRIRLNFLWAMGYNLVGLPLAAGALFPLMHTQVPPLAAGIAMVVSSLTVLLCSLSLRLWRRPATLPP